MKIMIRRKKFLKNGYNFYFQSRKRMQKTNRSLWNCWGIVQLIVSTSLIHKSRIYLEKNYLNQSPQLHRRAWRDLFLIKGPSSHFLVRKNSKRIILIYASFTVKQPPKKTINLGFLLKPILLILALLTHLQSVSYPKQTLVFFKSMKIT